MKKEKMKRSGMKWNEIWIFTDLWNENLEKEKREAKKFSCENK